MASDSIPNESAALASSNPKGFAKKKRANRSAKLKQCKLDARREQWLSQVNNKVVCKEEVIVDLGKKNVEKMEISTRGVEGLYIEGLCIHHFSDTESSPLNSPTSSVLGSNDSVVNFTSSSRSSSSSVRSSSCGTNGCFSGILSEEDEGNVTGDGCFDDWEAMADALASEDKEQKHNTIENDTQSAKQECGGTMLSQEKRHAWRSDDAFRPQSLPNLTKQCSFPLTSERVLGLGGSVWGFKNVGPAPTSCPICFEDFDFTDSSFVPCLCGFRLCLFCHKRILEEDARCPGCRKQYEYNNLVEGEASLDGGSLTLRLTRSCSMTTRP